MMILRSFIFAFMTVITLSLIGIGSASAQTVKITSSSASEIGNLNGQTIYQVINVNIELRAVIQPANPTANYQWTFTGSPQITGGSATSRIISLKWTTRGNYTASVSYNGGTAVTVNIVVTTDVDEVELTPRKCSDESQLHSITGEVPTFINFKNTTNKTVKVYWLNYSNPGQRVLYSTLTAGQFVYQSMWLTQPWVVTDENDNCLGIYEPINQTGRATIVNVSKVEFETILSDSEPLSLNPNAEGGRRFYPDKQNPGEAAIRNQVRVKATLSQYLPNKKIYFRSFDVDDPSANTAPVDDDSGANANAEDNRGMVGTSRAGQLDPTTPSGCTKDTATNLWGCTVDTNGVAVINFTTTMNPGDNFAIAASLDASYLNGLTVNGINLKDASMITLPIPPDPNPTMPYALARGARSEMLTIWRRLRIEVDNMSNVTGNETTGNVDTTIRFGTTGTTDFTVITSAPLEEKRFIDGRIVFGTKSFSVVTNSSSILNPQTQTDYATTIRVNNKPPASVISSGQTFTLCDDDDYNNLDGANVHGDNGEPIV